MADAPSSGGRDPLGGAAEGSHQASLTPGAPSQAKENCTREHHECDDFPPQALGLQVCVPGPSRQDATSESNAAVIPDSDDEMEEDQSSQLSSGHERASDDDHVPQQPQGSRQAADRVGGQRKKHPKNAREFMAILHEKEDRLAAEKQSGKRPANSEESGAHKRQMADHHGRVVISNLVTEAAGQVDSAPLANAGPVPAIQATTIRDQLSMLAQNVPPGADTRRTATQREDLKEAASLFGYRQVKARDGKWLYCKTNFPLMGHQLTATAWMVKRELGRVGPFGGLLADYMGMGKTIMSLTCVAGNLPAQEDIDEFSRVTLVVVPSLPVAVNWKQEAMKHFKDMAKQVAIYDPKAENPIGTSGAWVILLITTYWELRRQYPSDEMLKQLREKHQNDTDAYEAAVDAELGFLMRQNWYRVILDEAHVIKNFDGRTTKVCCALESKHRWALSGTPLANSAVELLPYLKFLRCPLTDCRYTFREKYMTEGKVNKRFETLVSMVMYRRMPKDAFLGFQILELPESHQRDIWIPLSRSERIVNNEINIVFEEALADAKAKSKAKDAKTIERIETRHHLTKHLRLRSSLSHFFNLEKWLRKIVEPRVIQRLAKSLAEGSQEPSVLDQMVADEIDDDCLEGYEKGVARMRERTEPVFGGKFEWRVPLAMLEAERLLEGATCAGCDAVCRLKPCVKIEPCGHFYCVSCHQTAKKMWANHGDNTPMKCDESGCRQPIDEAKELTTLEGVYADAIKDQAFREPARDSNGVAIAREADGNGCIVASARLDEFPLLPSAKLTAAMAVIFTWLEECPTDKVIVFSEFLGTIKVLGCMLQMAGIGFLYLTGGMMSSRKVRALQDFNDDDSKKILLSTMACGGQSLNLTVANRVIVIDPWWNTTKEKQAFCRVLRMGQTKPSHLVRILASADVDPRISELQQSKDQEINHALQDDGHVPETMDDAEIEEMFSPARATPRGGGGGRPRQRALEGRAAGAGSE